MSEIFFSKMGKKMEKCKVLYSDDKRRKLMFLMSFFSSDCKITPRAIKKRPITDEKLKYGFLSLKLHLHTSLKHLRKDFEIFRKKMNKYNFYTNILLFIL